MPPMPIRDTRPVEVKIFDLLDRQIGTIELPPLQHGQAPRVIVFQGKRCREADGSGFYPAGTFIEIATEPVK